MAFYIFPPNRGSIGIAKLESYCLKRLQFLIKIQNCNGNTTLIKDLVEETANVEDSECLIEGSKKDDISHFSLRLACSKDESMSHFFISAETALFYYRMSCLDESEMKTVWKPLRKFLHLIKNEEPENVSNENKEFLQFLEYILQGKDWDSLFQDYINGSSSTFLIPFQYVPELVSGRLVELSQGFAKVPCSKLCDVLKSLFRRLLSQGMAVAKKMLQNVTEDKRINRMCKVLKGHFRKNFIPFSGNCLRVHKHLRAEQVDMCAKQFPLCMKVLHQELRKKHRLRHFSRIQYTLFLKELGMPVHEALQFWRHEYLQKPERGSEGTSGCRHNWNKDKTRYTYSIRHLYGLEGSRKNYRGHCCSSIQSRDLVHDEGGGCPWKHFDNKHLQQVLKDQGLSDNSVAKTTDIATRNDYHGACKQHLLITVGLLEKSNDYVSQSNCCDKNIHYGNLGQEYPPQKSDKSGGKEKMEQSVCKSKQNSTETGCNKYKENTVIDLTSDNSDTDSGYCHQETSSEEKSCTKRKRIFHQRVRMEKKEGERGGQVLKRTKLTLKKNYSLESGCTLYQSMSLSRATVNPGSSGIVNVCSKVPNTEKLDIHDRDRCEESNMNTSECNPLDDDIKTQNTKTSSGKAKDKKEMLRDFLAHETECYEHDVCPSTQEASHSKQMEEVIIHKPVDFYLSYRNLVISLRSQQCNTKKNRDETL